MGLETATYISDLVATNPVGATDPKSQGDDHIRLIKATLLATFAAITGAVTASHTELNNLTGVTGKTGTGNVVLSASPTLTGTLAGAAASFSGTVAANLFSGSGASLTSIPVSALTTGGTIPANSGANLTALNASNISSGSLADGRLSANVPLINAANVFTANQKISGSALTFALNTTNASSGGWIQIESSGTAKMYLGNGALIGSNTIADIALRAVSGALVFSGDNGSTEHFKISSAGVLSTPNVAADEAGYKGIPSIHSAATTAIAASASWNGKQIYLTGSGVSIQLGAIFEGFSCTIINNTGGSINLTESSTTVYLAGGGFGSHGTRALAYSGIAHVQTLGGSTAYIVGGPGVT